MEKTYKVTDKATQWVGGKRVAEDGTVQLTEAQAAYDLARGVIKEASEAAPAKAPKGTEA